MQTIIPLERGLGMSLTTAFYFTPKGRALQKAGILPDVDLTDAMLQEDENNRSGYSSLNPNPANDIALQKALDWLKSDKTVRQSK